jgi:hypothetical protein
MGRAPMVWACVLCLACQGIGSSPTESEFSPPVSGLAMTVLSGGRASAAGSAVWIATVQRMGDARFLARGAPDLERWLQTVTELSPDFEVPPLFGALTLFSVGRAEAADAVLARAPKERFEAPYYRAVIAYFGRNDRLLAVKHLREAALLPGAPVFLGRWADRLERETEACSEKIGLLQGLQSRDALLGAVDLGALATECFKEEIERVAASWRLQRGFSPTLDELVQAGAVAMPPSPPGQCWSLHGASAVLQPCP